MNIICIIAQLMLMRTELMHSSRSALVVALLPR